MGRTRFGPTSPYTVDLDVLEEVGTFGVHMSTTDIDGTVTIGHDPEGACNGA